MATMALLVACAATPPGVGDPLDGDVDGDGCAALARAFDDAVSRAGVGDAQYARIAGVPWLRVDRFAASFAGDTLSGDATRAWLERLREADASARRFELANLDDRAVAGVRALARVDGGGVASSAASVAARANEGVASPESRPTASAASTVSRTTANVASTDASATSPDPRASLDDRVDRCGRALTARLAADPAATARVRASARVPDDYVAWLRVAGLYPLTALPFSLGVAREEAALAAGFARHAGRVGAGTVDVGPASSPRREDAGGAAWR